MIGNFFDLTLTVCYHLQTFWHSSAHVLGQALELEFGVDLTIGPALEEGFYYDCHRGDKVCMGCCCSSGSSSSGGGRSSTGRWVICLLSSSSSNSGRCKRADGAQQE